MPNTNLKYIIGTCSFIFMGVQWGAAQDANVETPAAYTTPLINFVRSWDARAPTTDPNVLVSRPLMETVQTTQYVDGLGRPLQTVVSQGAKATGTLPMDMVAPVVYDSYGREMRKYLPFGANTQGGNTSVSDGDFKMNPFQQQQHFYSDNNAESPVLGQGETFYYSKTEFEASPLNRPVRVYAEGNSWVNQGKGIQVKYLINTTTDDVRIWNVNDVSNGFGSYSTAGAYTAGLLFKTITVDEGGNQVVEFKTKEGLVILKKVQQTTTTFDNGAGSGHPNWLCTYYIYDNYNLLRGVIQPRGVELLQQNNWDMTALNGDILDEQCFRYEYDQRNRMIMKKVPGAGTVQMVYDARNRLVMTQDANLASSSRMQWLITQYDELNRPVATYLITDPAHYNDAVYHRQQASGSTSYPNVAVYTNELLTETHYDNYNGNPGWFETDALYSDGYEGYLEADPGEYPDPLTIAQLTNGLVTWTKVKVLGENRYIVTVNLYDEKKRIIQVHRTDEFVEFWDIVTNRYSFSGQLLRSHVMHNIIENVLQTYEVATKNTYDDLGRVTTIEKNLNGSGWKQIANLAYDALGQLKTKKLSPAFNNGAGIETLDYDYNIRGWVLGANREYAKSTSGTDHYFGFDLGYDKQAITSLGTYGAAQYNGNIAGTVWKSKGDGQVRKYDFTYDPVNRLTGADFNQYNSGFNKSAGVDFSVSNLTYDANGNIQTMDQKGLTVAGSSLIDQLRYTYEENSNRFRM